MRPRRYLLGVDAGRTKTVAMVADNEGNIVGFGRDGRSESSPMDGEKVVGFIVSATDQALDMARLDLDDISTSVFGLTGVDWPDVAMERRAMLIAEGFGGIVIVKNDTMLGWRAALSEWPYGVVVAAGTGANAGGIGPDGTEWLYGAYARGGGAFTMSQDALSAVFRSHDGRGRFTVLTERVIRALGYEGVDQLLRADTHATLIRSDLYALCPVVFEAAVEGDVVAIDIVERQGELLGEYAAGVVRRFGMEELEFDVVIAGSVFRGVGPSLIDSISRVVAEVAPRAHLIRPRFEPVIGAVLYAYDTASIPATGLVLDNLTKAEPSREFFNTVSGSNTSDALKGSA